MKHNSFLRLASKCAASAIALSLMFMLVLLMSQPGYALDPELSGQRTLGRNIILESAYNTNNGKVVFILQNERGPAHQTVAAVEPLYIVVYPSTVQGTIGTVNCQHQPMDNCPDHGPVFAGLAKSTVPSVYENGVWGHDHIGAFPVSSKKHDKDFTVTWVPVAVLFNTVEASQTHITTKEQLAAAEKAGQVTEIVLWDAAFQATQTTEFVYRLGRPITPVPAEP
jgi:hypothetical protein